MNTQNTKVHQEIQSMNKDWWEESPMAYNWREPIGFDEGTRGYFEEVDRRFLKAARFLGGERPFAGIIPFERITGKRVLEIGCGLGTHAKLLVESGANLTGIDLTDRAVEQTRKRLSIFGLDADIRVMDAELLEFSDEEFDMVWSWGVIHHSSRPNVIAREVCRVLRPGGEFRMMVYNMRSLNVIYSLVRALLTGKVFRRWSVEEILNHYADGYVAKHYTRKELQNMLTSEGFSDIQVSIIGQKSEVVPIPSRGVLRKLKPALLTMFPNSIAKFVLSFAGGMLFAVAKK